MKLSIIFGVAANLAILVIAMPSSKGGLLERQDSGRTRGRQRQGRGFHTQRPRGIPGKLAPLIAIPLENACPPRRCAMETVTVAASRGFTVGDMEMLVGSVVIIAAAAWVLFSKMKHLRERHEESRT